LPVLRSILGMALINLPQTHKTKYYHKTRFRGGHGTF